MGLFNKKQFYALSDILKGLQYALSLRILNAEVPSNAFATRIMARMECIQSGRRELFAQSERRRRAKENRGFFG